jgi:hypothetical protein
LTKAIVVFVICAVAFGLVGSAYAHKAEVIGDYKIEVGWENEPPIVGQQNSIEIIVTVATEHDKESHASDEDHDEMNDEDHAAHDEMKDEDHAAHDEMKDEDHMEHDDEMVDDHSKPGTGVSGLSDKLEATVSLNGQKTVLKLMETAKDGIYHAEYTPDTVGFPSVNLVGKIGQGDEFEITFHPEKVEELGVLAPLKQIHAHVAPNDVMCKEGLQLIQSNSGRVACVSTQGAAKLVAWGWGHLV